MDSVGVVAPSESAAAEQRCDLCDCAAAPAEVAKYTPMERNALAGTGLLGVEVGGDPVVRAVLLPRRGLLRFAGMSRTAWTNYEVPAFLCPWSPVLTPAVLSHGPNYVSDGGERCGPQLTNGRADFAHRVSHCPLARIGSKQVPVSYWIAAERLPWLKRRLIK